MVSQEFTADALNRLRRFGGQFSYQTDAGSRPASKAEWKQFFEGLEQEILAGSFKYRPFSVRSLPKNRKMFSTNSIENIMVMRKINDNVRRAYRLKQANRYAVIKQVQQALRETIPKHIVRLDIKSFYESIPKRRLLNQLRSDRLVSTRTIDLLDRLLRYTDHRGTHGVPRGLQISSTLAELHASNLERAIRAIPGVYYVARYVDDIVVFSFLPSESIRGQIDQAFAAHALVANVEKEGGGDALDCKCSIQCTHVGQPCLCAMKCKCKPEFNVAGIRHIDILGYRLAFASINTRKQSFNDVRTYLADKKIAKYRRRIHCAVTDYERSGDIGLLADRVLFLTGNYRLESTKVGGDLRGGIYYNFSLYQPFEDAQIFPENRLEHLDDCLKDRLLKSLSVQGATATQKRRLLSLRFSNGHLHRRMRMFMPHRIQAIGACWNES